MSNHAVKWPIPALDLMAMEALHEANLRDPGIISVKIDCGPDLWCEKRFAGETKGRQLVIALTDPQMIMAVGRAMAAASLPPVSAREK